MRSNQPRVTGCHPQNMKTWVKKRSCQHLVPPTKRDCTENPLKTINAKGKESTHALLVAALRDTAHEHNSCNEFDFDMFSCQSASNFLIVQIILKSFHLKWKEKKVSTANFDLPLGRPSSRFKSLDFHQQNCSCLQIRTKSQDNHAMKRLTTKK